MVSSISDNNIATLHDETDRSGPVLREPPHNLEVEAALLGAILRNNRAFEQVSERLEAAHFYAPAHRRIYEAIAKLIQLGQVAKPETLRHFFEQDESLEAAGGPSYLVELASNVVTVINAADYAAIIHDLYLKRELIALGETVVNDAFDQVIEDDALQQIARAEQHLYDLATTGELDRGVVDLYAAAKLALSSADEAFRRDSHVVGVTTGFHDLDKKLGGLHKSDLIILAGRPAMGKTALATNIAYNAAAGFKKVTDNTGREITEGGRTLFFSLEMSAEQLASRIMAERSEVPSDKVRRGEIDTEEFGRIAMAAQDLRQVPLYIDDTPALTISQLRQRARRVKRQNGLELIIVDYLQLLQGGSDKRNDGRVQEISEITRGLKTLAKELDVPVIALSQLSRAVEQREDKRPQLSDLRESGSIEQDADVVTFIFREEYYLEKAEPLRRVDEDQTRFEDRMERWHERLKDVQNTAEVIISKQRHGPTGSISLYFNGALTKFADLDSRHQADDY